MAKVSLKLWKYSTDVDGRSPVKLFVNHGQERRCYAVNLKGDPKNLFLNAKEFDEAIRYRSKVGKLLKEELLKAEKAIPNPFSWVQFESTYLNIGKSFFTYFEHSLTSLKAERPGTFLSYNQALKKWRSISRDFQPAELLGQLHKLELACKTRSTAGMYLRATRVVYNQIRRDFPDLPSWNYRINSKVSTHKARMLTLSELQKFVNVELPPAQDEARRIFMISFYTGGMNIADLLRLRWSDIKTSSLTFVREKTKSSGAAPIEIPVSDELKGYLGKPGKSLYVIDNFNRTGTAIELKKRIQGYIKNINKRIKAICITLNIEPFTTYAARHTFASQLKYNGVGTAMISELLGHTSVSTTEVYLRRFDLSKKAEAIKTINLNVI